MKSFLFKFGLLLVAMGVSVWANTGARPKPPIVAVMEAQPRDAFPPVSDLSGKIPMIQAVADETRGVRPRPDLLDLNQATAGELEALPGIGAVLAQRVIDFRTSAGGFRSVDGLHAVKGIGSKKFDRIKALVTVSPSSVERKKQREL